MRHSHYTGMPDKPDQLHGHDASLRHRTMADGQLARSMFPGRCMLVLLSGLILPGVTSVSAQDGMTVFPPLELIKSNIRETDISAAIEITKTVKERVLRTDNNEIGYIMWQMDARIFRCYKCPAKTGREIIYHYVTESGIHPSKKGTRRIISLRKKGDRLVVPGVGYSFGYSDQLNGLYMNAADESAGIMGSRQGVSY